MEGVNEACDGEEANSGGRNVKDIVQSDASPSADDELHGSNANGRDRRSLDALDESV